MVKAVVEKIAILHNAPVMSALNGKESGFSCPSLEGVFLRAVPYWHWAVYSGLLWRERIVIISHLTVSCSVHSVIELAEVRQILLKLCLRLFPEWDSENTAQRQNDAFCFHYTK